MDNYIPCKDCSVLGCPDRNCYHHNWDSKDQKVDNDTRSEDRTIPCGCSSCLERRNLYNMCPKRKDSPGYITPNEHAIKFFTLKELEYIVDIEFYYDCLPRNKHRKIINVCTLNAEYASTAALKKYPNATVLSIMLRE